jgi:Ion channel
VRVSLVGTSMSNVLRTSILRLRKWQERSREPGLTALLVIEVVLIFIAIPLAGMGVLPEEAITALFLLLVVATLVVTSRSHAAAAVVVVSVLLGPAGALLHKEEPSVLTDWLSAGGRLLALSALTFVIGRAVFGPGRVTLHRVQGAIVLYMNAALFFFVVYRLFVVLDPTAFSGLKATDQETASGAGLLYFSFSTLTTASFGDIQPVHPLARNLANLEAMMGQLYPATLLARLVSLELQHRGQAKP